MPVEDQDPGRSTRADKEIVAARLAFRIANPDRRSTRADKEIVAALPLHALHEFQHRRSTRADKEIVADVHPDMLNKAATSQHPR